MNDWGFYGACVGLVLLSMLAVQNLFFRRRISRLWQRVGQGPSPQAPSAGLPPLMRNYALRAGANPKAGDIAAILSQKAELRLKRGGLFTRLKARQHVALGEVGFVWHAQRRFGPLNILRVIDSYVGGEGRLEARLLGLVTVARGKGVELTLAEAYRYLAELPWAPDAILGNPALEWRIVGDSEIEARLNTRVGTARVVFEFDAAGDIVGMQARERPATDADGRPVRYDWRGRFGDYERIGERRLPTYGEVGYDYPEGYEVYFRARISDYQLG
ncbi:MAG: DUF6544 family protein [Paracoccaceae bacterium]